MIYLKLQLTNVRKGSQNFPAINLKLPVKIQLNITQENNKSQEKVNDDNKRKKKYMPYEEISRDFKKIKPPMFNGEIEKGEEAEAWLSGIKKYFQIYNYSDELKSQMAIYNLNGNTDIWWQDIKKVKGIKEIYVTWKTFKNPSKKNTYQNNTTKRRPKNFMS